MTAAGAKLTTNSGLGGKGPHRAPKLADHRRFGASDGSDAELVNVWDIEVGDQSRVYVLVQDPPHVRMFDSSGQFLGGFGARGRGPGEFMLPIGVDVDSTGRVWVTDGANLRLSVFDSHGMLLFERPRAKGFRFGRPIDRILADGRRYDMSITPMGIMRTSFVRLDSTFSPVETTFVDSDTVRDLRLRPFHRQTRWTLASDGGVWMGRTDTYRFIRLLAPRETTLVVEGDLLGPHVTPRDREAFEAVAGKVAADVGLERGESEFPQRPPAWRDLAADEGGSLWVVPATAEYATTDRMDVFAPDGEFLGRAKLGFDMETISSLPTTGVPAPPIKFRRGHLYAVTRNEDGTPFVVRARIVK